MSSENEFVREAKRRQREEKSRNLRYKRPALSSMGYEFISNRLYEISEECGNVRYLFGDEDNLEELLGGEDEAYEFKMAFSELSASAEKLQDCLWDAERESCDEDFGEHFDDCTVALIGNRYEVIGFDDYQEDYYDLTRFEAGLAEKESGKRLMRLTKSEMIAQIGQCVGILIAFYDLERQYDYLSAAFETLKGENAGILEVVKEIEAAYERIGDGRQAETEFDRLAAQLPERNWIE